MSRKSTQEHNPVNFWEDPYWICADAFNLSCDNWDLFVDEFDCTGMKNSAAICIFGAMMYELGRENEIEERSKYHVSEVNN